MFTLDVIEYNINLAIDVPEMNYDVNFFKYFLVKTQ